MNKLNAKVIEGKQFLSAGKFIEALEKFEEALGLVSFHQEALQGKNQTEEAIRARNRSRH